MTDKWLKLSYEFSGLFYKVGEQKCRRVLNIRKIDFIGEPDLMVIMMNPGGSHPIEISSIKEIKNKHLNKMVAAKHDKTQEQVIRFMERKGFNHARILNLTDVCNTESTSLKAKDRDYSIFHESKSNIVDEHFITNIPVLLAWGCKSLFNHQIDFALEYIRKKKVIPVYGYLNENPKNIRKNYFYHPMPRNTKMQEVWPEKVKLVTI